MDMAHFFIKIMEEFMKDNGLKIKCMEPEHYFMHQENQHMKDNGQMINFKEKALYTMKNHNYYLVNLIIEISIQLESMFIKIKFQILDQICWTIP